MNRAAAAMARHAQVVAGNKPASVAAPAPLNQQDRLMLVALESDLYRIKEIQSHARRNEVKKAELLPRYRAYLEDLLVSSQPRTPAIIVRNLIWAIDTADYDWALRLGLFAVAHQLPTPEGFRRDIRNLFVGDMATAALELQKNSQIVIIDWLFNLEGMSKKWDLIDEVRADLYKALAQEYERGKHYGTALPLYRLADKLNSRVRVQRAITRLEKLLEAQNAQPA
ncbi:phage terminase small subunit [Thiothrix sp.]|jgi:hypothetical protein|uniref:phage terminase small subunit n=1 Tax=Thiothrix sp. TaxID=1032 RepID=UPI00257B9754|nr:phage terminase small subunit [Thiothrix sp.]